MGGGRKGRAGGQHVIHQQNGPPRQRRRVARMDAHAALQEGKSFLPPPPVEGLRPPDPLKEVRTPRKTKLARHRTREQCRLVVSPLDGPHPMQRNGGDKGIGRQCPVPHGVHHPPARRLRDLLPVAVLERQNKLSPRPVVDQGGPRPPPWRGRRHTGIAGQPVFARTRQRNGATVADGSRDEWRIAPAGAAKPEFRSDRYAAAKAPGRIYRSQCRLKSLRLHLIVAPCRHPTS